MERISLKLDYMLEDLKSYKIFLLTLHVAHEKEKDQHLH